LFSRREAASRNPAKRAPSRCAAAVAANISSSCCTAGDRARTKGRVTKTTYIFSTQFQTLKGKRDPPAGPASIIPSANTTLGPPRAPLAPCCARGGSCVIKLFRGVAVRPSRPLLTRARALSDMPVGPRGVKLISDR